MNTKPMKHVAHAACYTLAGWIFETATGCNSWLWTRADKIERRFKCIGCTEAYHKAFKEAHDHWLKLETERIRMSQPNPYTHH